MASLGSLHGELQIKLDNNEIVGLGFISIPLIATVKPGQGGPDEVVVELEVPLREVRNAISITFHQSRHDAGEQ